MEVLRGARLEGNRIILLNNVVILGGVSFSALVAHHAREYSVQSRPWIRVPRQWGVIAIIFLMGIFVFGSGLAFQSQSSSTPLTSLFLSLEQLAWQLQVTGLVRHDLNLTIEDLLQMPQTSVVAAIYCLPSPEARQGYFHEGGNWTGVKLRALLNQASLLPTTQKLAFYASDGFTTDLSIDVALAENVILFEAIHYFSLIKKRAANVYRSVTRHLHLRTSRCLLLKGNFHWIRYFLSLH